jgi:uncharacterized protein
MNDDKTQMFDLLEEKFKRSTVINRYSKFGFLIGKQLYTNSIFISSEKVETWKLQGDHVTLKDFNFLKKVKPTPELLIIGMGEYLEDPLFKVRSLMSELNIPVDIMTTSAACRTWNVLLSEGRNSSACIKLPN